ncbi:MAG: hypothetical protein H6563_09665 [Lewinellaceae bacterium]|nr:hypothetical protein [Lewinellaceae bacterium]
MTNKFNLSFCLLLYFLLFTIPVLSQNVGEAKMHLFDSYERLTSNDLLDSIENRKAIQEILLFEKSQYLVRQKILKKNINKFKYHYCLAAIKFNNYTFTDTNFCSRDFSILKEASIELNKALQWADKKSDTNKNFQTAQVLSKKIKFDNLRQNRECQIPEKESWESPKLNPINEETTDSTITIIVSDSIDKETERRILKNWILSNQKESINIEDNIKKITLLDFEKVENVREFPYFTQPMKGFMKIPCPFNFKQILDIFSFHDPMDESLFFLFLKEMNKDILGLSPERFKVLTPDMMIDTPDCHGELILVSNFSGFQIWLKGVDYSRHGNAMSSNLKAAFEEGMLEFSDLSREKN